MTTLVLLVFIVGYLAIAFEHSIRVNKAAAALLTGVLCWVLYTFQASSPEESSQLLMEHFSGIASILFFLLGAMTIVELIDSHGGFSLITKQIETRSKVRLLWIVTIIAFFLSALLDNLTTTIVMLSLSGRMLSSKEDRWLFASMVVIAANAGGAFSPIGDVTTTMLWIGGQISTGNIMLYSILPSIAVTLVPLLIVTPRLKGQDFSYTEVKHTNISSRESNIMLLSGVLLLLFVPVFKMITHLPPMMGMMFSLGILWVIVTFIHRGKPSDQRSKYSVSAALQKIDSPSILFFLGILLAISALESFGLLHQLADYLSSTLGNNYSIGTALGVLSAVVDNVPLVAAAQAMYSLSDFAMDHPFWLFLALTTGTGGSIIIIGSAAGVAAMGIEKIDFMWYMKRISWIALLGFLAGIAVFMAQQMLLA